MKSEIKHLQKQLIDNFPDLEPIRNRSYNYSIVSNVISIIGVFGFFIILLFGNFLLSFISILVLAIFLIILHYQTLPRQEYKKYFDTIKSGYVATILKQIDTSFEYYDGAVPVEDINNSRLFGTINIAIPIQGQDHFKGTYKGVNLQISEIGEGELFNSTLIIADFNKTIKSETFIYDSRFDNDESPSVPSRPYGDEVILENLEFEGAFHTTSQDEIEARYILTHTFMERILTMKDYLNDSKIFMSFCNNKFSILLYNKQLFEPVLHESIKENKTLTRFYIEILYILKIIDILRLNDKIWKK